VNAGWIGALNGLIAVAAGAFGAHGLEDRLDAASLEIWDLAARYQMFHALALLVGAGRTGVETTRALRVATWGFVAGIVLFSGSLYLLATTGVKILGAITPIGGVGFLIGWTALAISFRRNRVE
jgi:uncharacterized membrane protein YgdD (TMEM256/DUF423 family)